MNTQQQIEEIVDITDFEFGKIYRPRWAWDNKYDVAFIKVHDNDDAYVSIGFSSPLKTSAIFSFDGNATHYTKKEVLQLLNFHRAKIVGEVKLSY